MITEILVLVLIKVLQKEAQVYVSEEEAMDIAGFLVFWSWCFYTFYKMATNPLTPQNYIRSVLMFNTAGLLWHATDSLLLLTTFFEMWILSLNYKKILTAFR